MKEFLGILLGVALFGLLGYGCTAGLRNHGIESCEKRGGTPVVSSWLSEDAWDVKCIEGEN